MARNSQSAPAAATVRRKKGDYASMALKYDPQLFQTETCLGELQQVCQCGALRFRGEPASMCCANGQVHLQTFPNPSDYLQLLLNGQHPHSKYFLDNIRKYNCVFQMTSEYAPLSSYHKPACTPSLTYPCTTPTLH